MTNRSRGRKVGAVKKGIPSFIGEALRINNCLALGLELMCAMNLKLVNCKVPSDTLNHDSAVLTVFQASKFRDDGGLLFCSHLCAKFLTWAIVP